MKKIVVAFDSFKGSLSSVEAAEAFVAGAKVLCPELECSIVSISDGGEGMAEAVVDSLGGELVEALSHDPLGREICASYGVVARGDVAVISMASASGLTLLSPDERNPLYATTFGTGELLLHAIDRGCKKIIVGLGGSATNDGGVGMLRALGYKFFDAQRNELQATIDILERVQTIVVPENNPLAGVELSVAVDVDNPLCGERGASMVYGRQKGADDAMIVRLDRALSHYASVVAQWRGEDLSQIAGMGAAGGMGFAFGAVLGVAPQSGIELMLSIAKFDDIAKDATLVVTGEGRIDRQTVMGKAPAGVLSHAQRLGARCIAIGGCVAWCDELRESGFDAIYAITPEDMPLEVAMRSDMAIANMQAMAKQIILDYNLF